MLTDLRTPPCLLLESQPVYEEGGIRVGLDQFLHHDGHLSTGLWVTEPATTRVVALTSDGHLILRWRWRHQAGPVWELPGADLPPGTDQDQPDRAARHGLAETGWTATTWTRLAEVGNITAVVDRTVHLYLATDLQPLDARPAEDTATPNLMAWSDAVAVARGAGLRDAPSIAAVLIAAAHPRLTHHTDPPRPGPSSNGAGGGAVIVTRPPHQPGV